jgi:RNA polymerase sigma-70 factor (ECF subfamily)
MPDFPALLRAYQSMVFSIAYHILQDRESARELAQEVFLQLHQKLDGFQSPEHVVFWLRRVTTHRSIDWVRRRNTRPQVRLDEVPEPAAPAEPGDPMLRRKLARLVASLPEKPRAVVVLRYQEQLDPSEIARILNMPVTTVKSHLQRSLALLREKLGRTAGSEYR